MEAPQNQMGRYHTVCLTTHSREAGEKINADENAALFLNNTPLICPACSVKFTRSVRRMAPTGQSGAFLPMQRCPLVIPVAAWET